MLVQCITITKEGMLPRSAELQVSGRASVQQVVILLRVQEQAMHYLHIWAAAVIVVYGGNGDAGAGAMAKHS